MKITKKKDSSTVPKTKRLTQAFLEIAEDDYRIFKVVFETMTKLLAKHKSSGTHDLFTQLERTLPEYLFQSLDDQHFDTLIELATGANGKDMSDPFFRNHCDALRMLKVNFENLVN